MKYARYRIIENSQGYTWKYKIQSRYMWPLPFWFDEFDSDNINEAHGYIEMMKSKSKVVHIE